MKSKILRIFLAIIVTLPMFTSVLAISAEDLLARLEVVEGNIKDIKAEYENVVNEYPEVISSLSKESQETINNIVEGKILADDMEQRVSSLKEELEASEVQDAEKLLEATNEAQTAFEDLVDENKDVVEEVKAGYSDMDVNEIKQVVEKATELVKALGAEVDTTKTYETMLNILDEAHVIALDLNSNIEYVISVNRGLVEESLTIDLLKELLVKVEAKDKAGAIDVLIKATENHEDAEALKEDLEIIKSYIKDLKDKLMELNKLDEQDLLMFSDSQKKEVADKFKLIEKDYIDFAKVLIDDYSENYIDIVTNLAYDESVDSMIDYANDALDYYAKYKDTVKSLTTQDAIQRLGLPEEMIEKAGLMVALGFVDTTNYNKAYVKETFKTQIDDTKDYLVQEAVDYLDHIDSTISNEVLYKYMNGKDAANTQTELRVITANRFTTLTNLQALKARVDKELLANKEELKSDINEIADYVYDMYNENILTSIIATIMKENDQQDKIYEADGEKSLIVTNKFISGEDFTKELGVPSKYKDIVEYTNLAKDAVKTGTVFTVTLSDMNMMQGTFAVLGDVFADGLIDARDYMIIKNRIMDNENISAIALVAADTFRDDKVDSRDYMVIKNFIMDKVEIGL